ncbi:MAG: MYXO-CTERM sorting domain-containing protein [Myxococcota bacterium]
MSFAYLRASLVLSLTLTPAVALAGGVMTGSTTDMGTSSGSDTGDTDGTDTGSGGTDGSDTGTSTGGGSSESCGEVGECDVSTDSVVIVSPMTGAEVGRPFDLQVTAPHTCYCDPCGCFAGPPNRVTVRVDGMTFDSCEMSECDTMDHTFSLDLAPGPHTIDAIADVELSPDFSAPIEVTVVGEVATGDSTAGEGGVPPTPPMPGTSSSGSDDSGTTEAAADGGGGGGCGCTTTPTRGGPLGALFGVLLLTGLRRRRR